jgi:hypothetical protein
MSDHSIIEVSFLPIVVVLIVTPKIDSNEVLSGKSYGSDVPCQPTLDPRHRRDRIMMMIEDPVARTQDSDTWTDCHEQDQNLGVKQHLGMVECCSKVRWR